MARPIVAFARLPEPKQLAPAFIPISRAIGPFTTRSGAAMCVVACTPFRLKAGALRASIAARTTGAYAGRAAGHHQVDREHPARQVAPARGDAALDQVGLAAERPEHCDELLRGRRHHG